MFRSSSKESTEFLYISNERIQYRHFPDNVSLRAPTLRALYRKLFRHTNKSGGFESPPKFWLQLGLWTIDDWKDWTVRSILLDLPSTPGALLRRYKPITIQVEYQKSIVSVVIKEFALHSVVYHCCKAFVIGII